MNIWDLLVPSVQADEYKPPMKPNYTGSGPAYIPDRASPQYKKPGSAFTNAQTADMQKTFELDPRSPWERLKDLVGLADDKMGKKGYAQDRK